MQQDKKLKPDKRVTQNAGRQKVTTQNSVSTESRGEQVNKRSILKVDKHSYFVPGYN